MSQFVSDEPAYTAMQPRLDLCSSQARLIIRHIRAILVDQGLDCIAVQSLVLKDLSQSRILPDDSPSGCLNLLCRLDAVCARFCQPSLEVSDVFSLALAVPSLVISKASGSLCVLVEKSEI